MIHHRSGTDAQEGCSMATEQKFKEEKKKREKEKKKSRYIDWMDRKAVEIKEIKIQKINKK